MVATLKPRIGTANLSRVGNMAPRAGATERLRGRKYAERRLRWLNAHPTCVYCAEQGRLSAAVELDHRVPLWKGGADDESNFASTCIPCHRDKTADEAKERGGT